MFTALGLWLTACTAASAASIGVIPKKLIVVDKLTAATKAKLVYVSKDQAAGSTKGSGTDVAQVSVQFDVLYGNGNASGAFALPAGASDGTAGWLVNKTTVAKYVNKNAPAGATEAKVAVIKPGKLLKIVGKGLGDTPFDVLAGGDPGAGGVQTAYCVTNGGEVNCHCSDFTGCAYKLIAGDTGAKLVCKTGTADPACSALAPPTTSTTSTTSTTTPSTSTLPPVCCIRGGGSYCSAGWNAAECLDGAGTPVANAVCDVTAQCVAPPGTPGDCCSAPDSPLVGGCYMLTGALDASACALAGGTVVAGAVCMTDGTCAAP